MRKLDGWQLIEHKLCGQGKEIAFINNNNNYCYYSHSSLVYPTLIPKKTNPPAFYAFQYFQKYYL